MDNLNEDYKKKFLESDNKFKNIFDLTSAASKVINSDLTILKVNQAAVDLFGFSAEEIEGTKILEIACPEYIKHWHDLQEGLWKKQLPFFKLDACLTKKDKSIVWVNVTTVLFDENGETFGFTVFDDITAKKELEESEKRLNMALQYSKTAVWEMSLTDFTVIRSKCHDEIFGYETQQLNWSKENYLHHLRSEEVSEFEQAVKSIIHKGGIDFKGQIKTANKTLKWVHWQGKTEKERDQEDAKVLGTIKDITLEKIAEQHKDEFISTVSHELKTPITSIKAQTQVLERKFSKTADVVTATMLKRINLQINRLGTLVKDLLEAGRIEEKSLPLRQEEYWFNEMVEDIVTETQRTTTSHQIIIEKNQPTTCFGDRERLGQVLSNLLTNAIKYSPGQDKAIVKVEKQENEIICSVQDFGIGISIERQTHIFERFYRVPADNNYIISGFGLGLYISLEIIKRMKGKLWLSSTLGEGSIFTFSIPFKEEV